MVTIDGAVYINKSAVYMYLRLEDIYFVFFFAFNLNLSKTLSNIYDSWV